MENKKEKKSRKKKDENEEEVYYNDGPRLFCCWRDPVFISLARQEVTPSLFCPSLHPDRGKIDFPYFAFFFILHSRKAKKINKLKIKEGGKNVVRKGISKDHRFGGGIELPAGDFSFAQQKTSILFFFFLS